MNENLLRTPLYEEHIRLNARMGAFGGWDMPIQYSGILDEHRACREASALFDICHMGEFYFKGSIEDSGIERAFTISICKIPPGKAKYGLMLNKEGKILDDCIVYRLSANELMIVVNAETTNKDFDNIKNSLTSSCLFENISKQTAKIDLQGPLSREIMSGFFGEDIKKIPYFHFITKEVLGEKGIISRTGYTGELGYEIYCNSEGVVELWRLFLKDSRVKPAGLGARDILRLEMGYSLYGHDIDENTTPLEARLTSFVDFNKDFIGKEALMKQNNEGPGKVKIAFKTQSRRSPRQHYKIYIEGNEAGEVTSGVFSPMLSCGIGLGYVKPEFSKCGTKILLKQENLEIEAEICDLPFYRGGTVRG